MPAVGNVIPQERRSISCVGKKNAGSWRGGATKADISSAYGSKVGATCEQNYAASRKLPVSTPVPAEAEPTEIPAYESAAIYPLSLKYY
ncbi:MAG: hypothetical protein LBU32_19495 [Clostridiales bacterium]|nr:hypothetical protein [Clostridiales bacterium]